MTVVIKAEGIGKQYLISHRSPERYSTLRDVITDGVRGAAGRVLGRGARDGGVSREEFWALRDVSFEISQGERVGIIGRNGAGKSTLLKILSRITEPTEGRLTLEGRVASLLEVGTGFHPELTGRENIFLNGAILGMTKREIRKNLDGIVAFAEVEKFLDTPVKRYSSGMFVRLAFAVAAHLETEIMVIDEVLAVGDAKFQKKCLAKMEEISREGRTILFVSHSMPMVTSFCRQALLLDQGAIVREGDTRQVIDFYFTNNDAFSGEVEFPQGENRPGDGTARLVRARIVDSGGKKASEVGIGEAFALEMEYQLLQDNQEVTPNFHVYNSEGSCVFVTSDVSLDPHAGMKPRAGTYRARCHVPANYLNNGSFYVGFALTSMDDVTIHFFEKDLLVLTVEDPIEGTVTRGGYKGPVPGMVRPLLTWESERLS